MALGLEAVVNSLGLGDGSQYLWVKALDNALDL